MLVIIIAFFVHGVDAVTRTPCTQTARFQDPKKGTIFQEFFKNFCLETKMSTDVKLNQFPLLCELYCVKKFRFIVWKLFWNAGDPAS